jgi:hypothetical protein
MLIKCAFVGQKTLIFIEMHSTTTTKKKDKTRLSFGSRRRDFHGQVLQGCGSHQLES